MVNIVGNHDGSSAVDYTVNPATGFPWATGPRNLSVPFNHLLPAWDAITGMMASASLLAAERHRTRTGDGQCVQLALSDVAFWMVANLGKIAEVQINRHERPKDGNYLYGAFGRDFLTKDDRRVMIVALTARQWKGLVEATGLAEAFDTIGKLMGVDLTDEGGRFAAREVIGATLKPWVLQRTMAELRETFDAHGVSWGPYQTFTQLVEEDPRCSPANPMFEEVEQPGIGSYLMPGSPLDFSGAERLAPMPAPVLGQHTDEVLAEVLGLADRRDRRALRARCRGGTAAGARLTRVGGAFHVESVKKTPRKPASCATLHYSPDWLRDKLGSSVSLDQTGAPGRAAKSSSGARRLTEEE